MLVDHVPLLRNAPEQRNVRAHLSASDDVLNDLLFCMSRFLFGKNENQFICPRLCFNECPGILSVCVRRSIKLDGDKCCLEHKIRAVFSSENIPEALVRECQIELLSFRTHPFPAVYLNISWRGKYAKKIRSK